MLLTLSSGRSSLEAVLVPASGVGSGVLLLRECSGIDCPLADEPSQSSQLAVDAVPSLPARRRRVLSSMASRSASDSFSDDTPVSCSSDLEG